MLLIVVSLLIVANIVNHSKGINNDVKIAFVFFVYLWLILYFSSPSDQVPDMKYYTEFYNSDKQVSNIDYLFSLIVRMAKSIGLGFNGFLLVSELVLFSIWFLASKRIINDIHLAFMVLIPFLGIYYFGIIIRACFGLCLSYFALTYLIGNRTSVGYFVYYSIVTAGVFFHASMVVFYAFPFYIFRKHSSVFLITIVLFALLIPVLNIQRLIADLLESYIRLFPSSHRFLSYTQVHANFDVTGIYSLTMIKYVLLALVFIWLRKMIIFKEEIYDCFLNIYVTGVLLIGLTYFILAGNRLSYLFFFFEFALVALLYENSRIPKKLVLIGAILLCCLNFANLISAIPEMLTF